MKYLLIALISIGSAMSYAQDAGGGGQKVRFGLLVNSGTAWLSTDNSQESEGFGFSIGYGLQTEFRVSDYVSISTGLSQKNYSAGVSYADSAVSLIYESRDEGEVLPADTSLLLSRKYYFNSVALPFKLKLKTPEIGYLTYFLEAGIIGNINYKTLAKNNKVFDAGEKILSGDNEEIDVNDATNWFRAAVSFSLGAEYNLVGNTSLFFLLNWENGITNMLKDDDGSKTKLIFPKSKKVFEQEGSLSYVGLTVGLLF